MADLTGYKLNPSPLKEIVSPDGESDLQAYRTVDPSELGAGGDILVVKRAFPLIPTARAMTLG